MNKKNTFSLSVGVDDLGSLRSKARERMVSTVKHGFDEFGEFLEVDGLRDEVVAAAFDDAVAVVG